MMGLACWIGILATLWIPSSICRFSVVPALLGPVHRGPHASVCYRGYPNRKVGALAVLRAPEQAPDPLDHTQYGYYHTQYGYYHTQYGYDQGGIQIAPRWLHARTPPALVG